MKEDTFLCNKRETEAQSCPHHVKSIIKQGRSTDPWFSDRTLVFSFVPVTVSQDLRISGHFFLLTVEENKILPSSPRHLPHFMNEVLKQMQLRAEVATGC